VDLGVEAVYLNPVFEAPSSHKYDAATWHHIDPNFGPDPEGDRRLIKSETPDDPATWVWTAADRQFLELIEKLHEKNIHIIIDGVFNHMGLNSWVYRDLVKNQRESRFSSWMKVERWADETEDGSTDIRTWEGYRELPEIMQNRSGITEGPKNYIFEITRRWMDPAGNGDLSKGIDGWRLDVAFCIKHPFWKKWRKYVRSINPEAFLVAEVIDTPEKQKPYLKGDEFDAVMNYNFAFAVSDFFIRKKRKPLKPSELDHRLNQLREAFPDEVTGVMHNLLGSHDTDRTASRILNNRLFTVRRWSDYYEKAKMVNPEYKTGKPGDEERAVHRRMIVFQMTWPGSPVIYYGDEAGMWGPNDPCNRKPMLWPDLEYDHEMTFPNEPHRKPEPCRFDHEMHDLHRRLIRLRREWSCLKTGSCRTVAADDRFSVFGFERYIGEQVVLILFNNGIKPYECAPPDHAGSELLFSWDSEMSDNGIITLKPGGVIIAGKRNGSTRAG
jgi:cyclomaltodextrinase